MKKLTSLEDFKTAIENYQLVPKEEEMNKVVEEFGNQFDDPIVISLKDYMDCVYTTVEEEVNDWSDYIDYSLYLFDIAGENSEDIFVIKTETGYCVIYENIPEDEDDEAAEEEEEGSESEECCCKDKDCCK